MAVFLKKTSLDFSLSSLGSLETSSVMAEVEESVGAPVSTASSCCVYGFGYNGFSQLDLVEPEDKYRHMVKASPARLCPSNADIAKVEGSWTTTLYLRENGQVLVMGWIPGTEHLGNEEDLLHGKHVSSIACSWNTLVFLTKAGECFVWRNFTSKGSSVTQVVPPDQQTKFSVASCGESHCILVTELGRVGLCTEDKNVLETEPNALIFKPLSFEHKVNSVDCGKEHVLMLTSSGSLYSCGNGSRGQLGHGLTESEENPRSVEALDGIRVVSISAGGWHSAAITEYGDLYMWGWNQSGQLGLQSDPVESHGTTSSDPIQQQMMPVPYPVDFPRNLEVTAVSCGSRHSAAITGDGSLWTWGWGFYGQLGHGNSMDRRTPTQVAFFSGFKSNLSSISCVDWNTFVLTE